MANVTASNKWTLDTVGAIWSYTTQGPVKIRKMIWRPNAAADSLLVEETDGGDIWAATALDETPVGDQELDFQCGRWFDGFTLTTLTAGGILDVYLA